MSGPPTQSNEASQSKSSFSQRSLGKPESYVRSKPKALNSTVSVVSFLKSLFSLKPDDITSVKFFGLTAKISTIIRNSKGNDIEKLKKALIGHVGIFEGRIPWIDLEAASLLHLDSKLLSRSDLDPNPKEINICPTMKTELRNGQYIPLQHVLYCLNLFQFHSEIKIYPLKLTEPVPVEFIVNIRRNDVIRGANIYGILVGQKFPHIGLQFLGLIEDLWCFMFIKKFSAAAGLELYNECLFNFSKSLGQGVVILLNEIPLQLMETIKMKYSH